MYEKCNKNVFHSTRCFQNIEVSEQEKNKFLIHAQSSLKYKFGEKQNAKFLMPYLK